MLTNYCISSCTRNAYRDGALTSGYNTLIHDPLLRGNPKSTLLMGHSDAACHFGYTLAYKQCTSAIRPPFKLIVAVYGSSHAVICPDRRGC